MLFQENLNICKGNNFPSLATGGKGHAAQMEKKVMEKILNIPLKSCKKSMPSFPTYVQIFRFSYSFPQNSS